MKQTRIGTTGPNLARRRFVQGVACVGGIGALGLWPSIARAQQMPAELSGDHFDLQIGSMPVNITGRRATATTVNGSLPAPILRFREGDTVTLNVTNRLDEPTSLHWHGLRLPAAMDGVPGLTFRGIMPGETFTYRFPIKQTGTYWYHSHSGMQEQTGLYGPLILEPRGGAAFGADREHVIMLSDWTDEDPMTIVSNLKQEGNYYNPNRPSLVNLAKEADQKGLGAALDNRLMWSGMRMSPTDIMDVTGLIYTFLINGQPPAANWMALFKPGERVRLRVINGSSMTTFDVRIPGLKLTVVAADGSEVEPVTVDEFRIGVAETYDILVTPLEDTAYTVFAQAQDRSGFARATLAPRTGMAGVVPPLDPRPMRTMTDMGMKMDGKSMAGMNMPDSSTPTMKVAKPVTPPPVPMASMPRMDMSGGSMSDMKGMAGIDMSKMPGMKMASTDHSSMSMAPAPQTINADGVTPMALKGAPSVDNIAMDTKSRLGEAGDGLANNGRHVLTYQDLKALNPAADASAPTRAIEFHLTGNMERWVWGFDGKKFSEAEPVRVALGERIRFVLINDTMMEHPIHLHGFLFEVENGQDGRLPLKHTINVKPGERMSFVYTADAPGHWAFHCHLLYHMETGMFRTVVVA